MMVYGFIGLKHNGVECDGCWFWISLLEISILEGTMMSVLSNKGSILCMKVTNYITFCLHVPWGKEI
jgi:hypothetical protein